VRRARPRARKRLPPGAAKGLIEGATAVSYPHLPPTQPSLLRCYHRDSFVKILPPREATARSTRPRAETPGTFAAPRGRCFSSRSKGVGRADTRVCPCPLRADSSSNTLEGRGEGGSCRTGSRNTGRGALTASKTKNPPRQRRFHWHRKSLTNHARVDAAPIRAPEKASCRHVAAPISRN
jgi:hypothetical protein